MKRALLLVSFVTMAMACDVDTAPDGLRATPPGDGPRVRFELTHRPLPDVPLPNDIATFADPTSRTGRRINASQVAPTLMERIARQGFDDIEGWGTFAPITLSFERAPGADPHHRVGVQIGEFPGPHPGAGE